MQSFTLPNGYTIVCRSEKTRYGFRHLASLLKDGYEVAKCKACYYNRTWESYEFQTVIRGVLRKQFNDQDAEAYESTIHQKASKDTEEQFGSIGAIAKLGEIFCDTTADKNKWKERMLKAGLSGLDFPDDFDQLPEAEKEERLNKVIALTQEKHTDRKES